MMNPVVKKIGSLLAHGLVTSGMVYALIALSAVPAAACTPAECANLQQVAGNLCQGLYNCDGGYLRFCNSTGFGITCLYADGSHCHSFSGQCSN
jgi:hypothetical protein